MTHEYDDPITAKSIAAAVKHAVQLHGKEGGELADIAADVVKSRFCCCVNSPDNKNASVFHGLVEEIRRQAEIMIHNKMISDEIDESSLDSFPASDPPAWINGGIVGAPECPFHGRDR